ncbi:MAG: ABC transporter permease [Promethearchaeota archaeon]
MSILDNRAIQIAIKNLKEKRRNWVYFVFGLGFPIMFTIMTYLVYGKENLESAFPGLIMYAMSISTINAAIFYAYENNLGMIERLDTMPTKRKNIFIGSLISESLFSMMQLIIMFVIGYGIFGLYFENTPSLIISFFIAVLFGISSVGMGIMIGSIPKNWQAAYGVSFVISFMLLILSGGFFPFESPIVYFTPAFWAKQVFLQISTMGHGLMDSLYSGSSIGLTSEAIPIPIWGGILIIVAYTIAFIYLGIKMFQKKTKF